MGSEKLGSEHPLASVTLAALKLIKAPVLVVKPDSCGMVVKEEIDRKKRSDRRSGWGSPANTSSHLL